MTKPNRKQPLPTSQVQKIAKKHVLDSSSDEEGRFPNPEASVFTPAEVIVIEDTPAVVIAPADAAGSVLAPEPAEETGQERLAKIAAEKQADEADDRADDARLGVGIGHRRRPESRPRSRDDEALTGIPRYLSEESDEDHVARHKEGVTVEPSVAAVNEVADTTSAASMSETVKSVPSFLQRANLLELPVLKTKPSVGPTQYVTESVVHCEQPNGPGGYYTPSAPVKRTWRPVVYKPGQGPTEPIVGGECTELNPFGAEPLAKDQVFVLHPGVMKHMLQLKRGRIRSLASDLSTDQKTLLRNDFVEALSLWEPTSVATEMEMWKSMEASRYALFNKSYGLADVNVAVKLLIPQWLTFDKHTGDMEDVCWSVKAVHHFDGTTDLGTKFDIIEARSPKNAQAIPVPTKSPSLSSSSSVSESPGTPEGRPTLGVVGIVRERDKIEIDLLNKHANHPTFGEQPPAVAARRALDAQVLKAVAGVEEKAAKQRAAVAAERERVALASAREKEIEREKRDKAFRMLPPMPPVKCVISLSGQVQTKTPTLPTTTQTKNSSPVSKTTSVVKPVVSAEEDLELKEAIRQSKAQNKIDLDERIRKLQEEKSKLDELEEPEDSSDSSSEASERSSDEEWDEKKILLVQGQILSWHEKQRATNSHTSAVPGDPDFDAQKLHLLIRHLETDYEQKEGGKRKGKMPVVPKQADELLSRVIANCGGCKRQAQDRKQRKRDRTVQESRQAAEDAEMTRRYNHRLTESEFESDGEHDAKADKFCNVCKEKGGRPGHMGKHSLSRDPQDRD